MGAEPFLGATFQRGWYRSNDGHLSVHLDEGEEGFAKLVDRVFIRIKRAHCLRRQLLNSLIDDRVGGACEPTAASPELSVGAERIPVTAIHGPPWWPPIRGSSRRIAWDSVVGRRIARIIGVIRVWCLAASERPPRGGLAS